MGDVSGELFTGLGDASERGKKHSETNVTHLTLTICYLTITLGAKSHYQTSVKPDTRQGPLVVMTNICNITVLRHTQE